MFAESVVFVVLVFYVIEHLVGIEKDVAFQVERHDEEGACVTREFYDVVLEVVELAVRREI